MKTTLSALFVLAASLTILPNLAAAPARDSFDVLRVRSVKSWTGDQISRGDAPYTVRKSLGSPHETLSADVWVYRGYYPAEDSVPTFRGNTLLVTFTRNKVSDIHLVNPRAQRILAAHLRSTRIPVTIADIAKPTTAHLP